MKTIAILSLCTVLCTVSYGQSTDSTVSAPAVVAGSDSIKPGYNVEDLSKMKKVDLTTIYLNQVASLSDLLGKTALQDGDVPTNSYLRTQWKVINKASLKHNKVIIERYKSIIPYADKQEIVNSIMFLQEMILQMTSI